MKLTAIGKVLAFDAPIVQLMEDLGEALNDNPDSLFLGGGNPANVPQAQPVFAEHLQALTQMSPHQWLGVYQSPEGNTDVRRSVAGYLQSRCDWPVTADNIALVGGSQTAFFILLNLFCDTRNPALLPMVPEYLGYGSQTLSRDSFSVTRPLIDEFADHRFKYHVDFDALSRKPSAGLLCVSSPANPSGNVLAVGEMKQLAEHARVRDVPLVLDYAYGKPFPGLVWGDQRPFWQAGSIAVLSLSKLGLPGVRCSVVVADPEVIQLVARANTIISLAGPNLGPAVLKRLIDSGDMDRLSRDILPSFYQAQRQVLVDLIDKHLAPFDYALHEPEGGFFVWLWLRHLPITAMELYQRLKCEGLLIMPGETFFFTEHTWHHARQCIRLTYCQPPEVLEQAIKCLAMCLSKVE